MRNLNMPQALNKRSRLPEGVSRYQTLYVGRDENGNLGQWGSPFVLDRNISDRDLSLIPKSRHPHWFQAGRKPNRAQVIALYALLLGVRLDRGERTLTSLCYTDRGAQKPFWPVCCCAPQSCHGDILGVCAYFYCCALSEGIMHHRAQGMVRDALLELEYRLPGHLQDHLKAALSQKLRSEGLTERTDEVRVAGIMNGAAFEALTSVEATGGIWTDHRLRRTCLDRLCRAIGLDGGHETFWRVRPTSSGIAIEIHRDLLDETLEMVTRELNAAGWMIKDAGATLWREPDT